MNRVESLSLGRKNARRAATLPGGDPELPLLSSMTDLDLARDWLRGALGEREQIRILDLETVEILRYRPGRRCTFRFRFGGRAPTALYLKLYRKGKARRVVRILENLHRQGPWPDLRLPAVLAIVPADGAVLLEEIPGHSLEESLAAGSTTPEETDAIGEAVAMFHSLSLSTVEQWSVEDEQALLDGKRDVLAGHPGLGRSRVGALLEKWAAALAPLAASSSVLLHRDLHPQQILLDGRNAGLVDLDNLAAGPPEIDLGNLLAHLDLFGLFLHRNPAFFQNTGERFLSSYGAIRRIDTNALRLARSGTLIRLAGIYAQSEELDWLTPDLFKLAEKNLDRGGFE